MLSFVPDLHFRLDAHDHLPGLHLAELVGHLVSGRGAGRRRLRRAAHVQRQGREAIRCSRRCGSTSRTTRCGPGRGSWSALASLILFPDLQDPETGYIRVMIDYLPPSLRGLMVAAFAAAFMSTIATQLNWGASYLVNDFYRRFLKPSESDRHYVTRLAVATVLLTIISAVVTFYHGFDRRRLETAARHRRGHRRGAAAALVLVAHQCLERSLGHGCGLRGLGRAADRRSVWIATTRCDFAWIMIITVAITTAVWLAVTFLTAPESNATLVGFYRRVRPSAALDGGPIARLAPDVPAFARSGLEPARLDLRLRADLRRAVRHR